MTLSDPELGPALRALATDQPLQPADRLTAVTRKAHRIRRTRVTLTAAASVMVLATAALGLSALRTPAPDRFAATPVTAWPDRSLPADRSVADGAVAAWALGAPGTTEGLRWLFRGTVPLPDHQDTSVAVFVASHTFQPPVLVVATIPRADVDSDGTAREGVSSTWAVRELPLSRGLDSVALYLQHGTGPFQDALFVLADPAARTLRWQQDPLPFASAATHATTRDGGTLRSRDGVFVGELGPLLGRVTTTQYDGHGHARPTTSPDDTVSTPVLVPPAAPDVPPGWRQNSSGQGQSQLQDGSWGGEGYGWGAEGLTGRFTGFVRCYGGGTMTFAVYAGSPSASAPPLRTGSAACDGQTHRALPLGTVPPKGYEVRTTHDGLQAYYVRFGTVR